MGFDEVTYALLKKMIGRGSSDEQGSFIPSYGVIGSIALGTSWSGNDPYTQTVTLTGYTPTNGTMVSVLPDTSVLTQMASDGINEIFITNNNGTLTATAIGGRSTAAMTLHVLCSETDVAETINGLSVDVSDLKNAIDAKAPVIINTASGDIASFEDGADGMQIRKIVGTIETAEGGSGYTECNIYQAAGNILQINNQFDANAIYNLSVGTELNLTARSTPFVTDNGDGSFTFNNINAWRSVALKIPVINGTHYYFRWRPFEDGTTARFRIWLYFCDSDNKILQSLNGSSGSANAVWNFTCTADNQYLVIGFERRSANSDPFPLTAWLFTLSINNYLHTPTPAATVHNISFIDPQTETTITILNGTVTLNADGSVDIVNSGTGDTYHLADVVNLSTFYGQNNIWIDTGAITECDYPADTKLYVDGLTAPDEDMIANANIASGKYFVVNNQLYLSTAAIAAGASIIPGTNCTATNLAEALNALNT